MKKVLMANQAEILLTRFFPIIGVVQGFIFFKTIWRGSYKEGPLYLYMALVILLILGTNSYALFQLNQHGISPLNREIQPIQLGINYLMTSVALICFLSLVLTSKSPDFYQLELGIATVIFVITLINVGFSIQSFGVLMI